MSVRTAPEREAVTRARDSAEFLKSDESNVPPDGGLKE